MLAELLTSGRYDRHSRALYARRRTTLLRALAELPLAVEGTAAGLQVALGLPAGVPESDVLAALARLGVGVAPLSPWWLDPQRGRECRAGSQARRQCRAGSQARRQCRAGSQARRQRRAGSQARRQGIVVGYAAPAEHAFAGAVEALVTGLRACLALGCTP